MLVAQLPHDLDSRSKQLAKIQCSNAKARGDTNSTGCEIIGVIGAVSLIPCSKSDASEQLRKSRQLVSPHSFTCSGQQPLCFAEGWTGESRELACCEEDRLMSASNMMALRSRKRCLRPAVGPAQLMENKRRCPPVMVATLI